MVARAFVSAEAFLSMVYQSCNVAGVSEYHSRPQDNGCDMTYEQLSKEIEELGYRDKFRLKNQVTLRERVSARLYFSPEYV